MTVRTRIAAALVVVSVITVDVGSAQERSPRDLARDLARVLLDGTDRQSADEQIRAGLMQSMAVTLQNRLHRRLLDVEWQMLATITQRFVAETLSPTRTEELAADIYLQHFDGAELAALLTFQRSPLGRKAARLAPVIATESSQAIEREIQQSAALPGLLDELRRAFPVLGPPQAP
jgi:hypothetical protein